MRGAHWGGWNGSAAERRWRYEAFANQALRPYLSLIHAQNFLSCLLPGENRLKCCLAHSEPCIFNAVNSEPRPLQQSRAERERRRDVESPNLGMAQRNAQFGP